MPLTKATTPALPERDIALELAQIQRERGYAMTREEFLKLGFSADQLDEHEVKAGQLFAAMEVREAA